MKIEVDGCRFALSTYYYPDKLKVPKVKRLPHVVFKSPIVKIEEVKPHRTWKVSLKNEEIHELELQGLEKFHELTLIEQRDPATLKMKRRLVKSN